MEDIGPFRIVFNFESGIGVIYTDASAFATRTERRTAERQFKKAVSRIAPETHFSLSDSDESNGGMGAVAPMMAKRWRSDHAGRGQLLMHTTEARSCLEKQARASDGSQNAADSNAGRQGGDHGSNR